MPTRDGVIVVLLTIWTGVIGQEKVTLNTQQGIIIGIRTPNIFGIPGTEPFIDVFRGVPYAEPPIKQYRFKRAVPAQDKPGVVLNANTSHLICSQVDHWFVKVVKFPRPLTQSEDCLYLSVFTPYDASQPTILYPVILFLHGGSYQVGAGNYFDGSVLASHGLVVVTINYRLGPFGFLGDGGNELPGNNGIHDQIQALKWVQQFISAYRGDANRVTVMGHSAGGWSTGIHLLSPLSRGLLHSVIVQSGPVLTTLAWQTAETLRFTYGAVMSALDCTKNVAVCLHNSTTRDILDIAGFVKSVPWIDGELLTDRPDIMIKKGIVNPVPVIMGTTEHEWARFIALMNDTVPARWLNPAAEVDLNVDINEQILESIRYGMEVDDPTDNQQLLMELVKYEYTNFDVEQDSMANRDLFLESFSDMTTTAPTMRMASLLTAQNIPVYVYRFLDTLPVNVDNVLKYSWLSNYSYHEVDLPFTFGCPFSGEQLISTWFEGIYSNQHKIMSQTLMSFWRSMAYYGNPNRPGMEQLQWKRYEEKTKNYVALTNGMFSNEQNFRVKRMVFWNELYNQLSELAGIENTVAVKPTPASLHSAILPSYVTYVFIAIAIFFILVSIILSLSLIKLKNPTHTSS